MRQAPPIVFKLIVNDRPGIFKSGRPALRTTLRTDKSYPARAPDIYSANFNQSDYDNGSFTNVEWYRQRVAGKGGPLFSVRIRRFIAAIPMNSLSPSHASSTRSAATAARRHAESRLGHDCGSFYAPLDGVNSYLNYVTSPYSGWKVV
jgi:hypothetical protein